MRNKKILIIIIAIIVASLGILLLLTRNGNDDKHDISVEDNFFIIQDAINKYFYYITYDDSEGIRNIADEEFLNNFNLNNLFNYYNDPSFQLMELLSKNSDNITYYFASGYTIDYQMIGSEIYNPKVNFLLIVKGNTFRIRPLDNGVNIQDLYNSLDLDNTSIQTGEVFSLINPTDKNKLETYINNFLNLLIVDKERAYNFISDKTKEKYGNYSGFVNNATDIYNNLSSSIKTIAKQNDNIFVVTDNNDNKITIYENHIMNYKLEF